MADAHDRQDEGRQPDEPWPPDGDAMSLEDLGAAYARAAAQQHEQAAEHASPDESDSAGAINAEAQREQTEGESATRAASGDRTNAQDFKESEPAGSRDEAEDEVVTPEAIIEAALFVGHPENKPLTEQRLASLMRGVTPEEVLELIDQLNESYESAGQALRIARDDHGFRMTVAPEMEYLRRSFLGKVREARLSQMAIEVLALVAYQPGITAQKVQDQRGRESGALLSQLVRRQLLRMERLKPESGGRAVPHYFPTDRFLDLFGLESLEDLPQVDEEMTNVQ